MEVEIEYKDGDRCESFPKNTLLQYSGNYVLVMVPGIENSSSTVIIPLEYIKRINQA